MRVALELTCPISGKTGYREDFEQCPHCERWIHKDRILVGDNLLGRGIYSEDRVCVECLKNREEICKKLQEREEQKKREETEKQKERDNNLSKVKMYAYGSPMSRKLSNTEGIEKKEIGTISLPNYCDITNYKAELARMTLEMGGDTLINLKEKFLSENMVTVTAVVLKLDWHADNC